MYNNYSVRRLLLIAALLLACAPVGAQVNVEIVGSGANLAGRRVELLAYEDMLTMRELLLDSARADSTGAFRLGTYLTYPRLVVLQVECYSQSFYAEPGRTYRLWLPEFRWEQDEERNVHLDPVALPFEFLDLPADELNVRMLRFDEAVDTFLAANRIHFDPRFRPDRRWMDSLERAVGAGEWRVERRGATADSAAADSVRPLPTSFFDRYRYFSLAQMRFGMRFASRRQMLTRVLPQPILYHDECYMRTLFDVLGGMVSQGMRKVSKQRLVEWVYSADLDRYLDSLGTEPLLYDEQLRELAALVALKESLYDPDYDADGVRRMLALLATRSKWGDHRRLAERLLQAEGLRPATDSAVAGAPFRFAPALPDVDRRLVSLDSLQGKWIYLSFVRVGDPNSLREIETLAHFKDSVYAHNPDVVFVSVACDREFQKMYHFLRNNKRGPRYSWTWLHFDGHYRWLEQMGVVSYPTFLLFDPEGRQPYSVTPTPESGFLLRAPWQKAPAPPEKPEFVD